MSIEQVQASSQDPQNAQGVPQEKTLNTQQTAAELQKKAAVSDKVELSKESQHLARNENKEIEENKNRRLAKEDMEKAEQARERAEQVQQYLKEAENLREKSQQKKTEAESQAHYEERYENRYDNRYADERKTADFSGTNIDELA